VKNKYINDESLQAIIQLALMEDVGEGDHTSLASVPDEATNQAELIIKQDGVIAGLELALKIFKTVDESLQVGLFSEDGEQVKKGDVVLQVLGNARAILTAERTVLNFMQRMSGIATYTRKLVDIIEGTGAKILDTRKTTPGLRILEKWAVTLGGGENHRFGLFDMILLKDNHIDFAGGIKQAIRSTQNYLQKINKPLRIEIETRSIEEVNEVIKYGGVHVIMLDNMDLETMEEAVRIIDNRYQTEASGSITEENIRAVAECGVDFISVGALTHSIKSQDMSLKALKSK